MNDDGIPKLRDLVRDMPPVIARVLNPDKGPYQRWFFMDKHGELRRKLVLRAVKRMARDDELKPYMQLMDQTPRREGTPPHPATGSPGAIHLYGGENRSLNERADLIGPLWLGKNVRVRLAARLIGPLLVGNDVRISSNTNVVRSIVCERSIIDDGANLKDSIVGSGCYIGVNARLLSKEVDRENGEPLYFECWYKPPGRLLPQRMRITVPRPKMGCVIGDRCRIGASVTLMPGTVLMPGVVVPEFTGTLPAGIYSQEDLDRYLKGR